MNEFEIAEKLSGDTDNDTEMLTALMLSEKDRDAKRRIIEMLDKVNDFAHLKECGLSPSGIEYADFILGNCLFEMPDESLLTKMGETRKAAEAGDADAQYTMAMYQFSGVLGFPDYNEAVKWLKLSAEQGNADAMYEIGVCYMNGEGLPHSYPDAEKYFKMAAEKDNLDAILALGMAYRGGRGLGEHPKEAYECFSRAAELGSAEGYLHLGICTFNGTGTEADVEKAIEIVKEAERRGSGDAKMLLRRMQRYYEEEDLDELEIAALRNREKISD